MEILACVAFIVVLLSFKLPVLQGHGMMVEPAMRSSLWRFDYPGAEPNYNDNGVNCGGFTNQHERQNGRCGVCGDPYQGPRDNEAGGKYAKGIIARTYKAGQYITVVSDITANHGGFIELKLCPHNNPRVPVTQQCLNQYPLQIRGHGTRYHLTSNKKSDFKIRHTVKLPDYVTCRQCVLQWYWKAGQHSGIDPITKVECIGCGKQEEFINCADIAITDEYGMFPSVNTQPPQITTQFPMYDGSSFMFQNQGLFPDYFDEYNPYFSSPSTFSYYDNPFLNNRPNFRQQMQRGFSAGLLNAASQLNIQQKMRPQNRHTQQSAQPGNVHTGFNRQDKSQIRNTYGRNKINKHLGARRPLIPRKTRPIISRNNRPNINKNRQVMSNSNRDRNSVYEVNQVILNNKLQTTEKQESNPLKTKVKPTTKEDNSESNDILDDDDDDDDLFLSNTAFWQDFNSLLNNSSPETKQALYEIADDAGNLEEFHQNVKLMLQMQGDLKSLKPSQNTDSDDDESLDMDWLLTEAKGIDLDSDEQVLLGLTKEKDKSEEKLVRQEKSNSNDHLMVNNFQNNNFHDENTILDDSISDNTYSDGFEKSSEEIIRTSAPKYDDDGSTEDVFGPSSQDINMDYDSNGDLNNNEIDNSMSYLTDQMETTTKKGGSKPLFNHGKIKPWNENVLYKTDILDYDNKDVDTEGDNQQLQPNSDKNQQTIEDIDQPRKHKADKVQINYMKNDIQDYSESENEGGDDEFNEDVSKWKDYSEDNEINDDSWSVDSVGKVEADTVIVTAGRYSPKDEEEKEQIDKLLIQNEQNEEIDGLDNQEVGGRNKNIPYENSKDDEIGDGTHTEFSKNEEVLQTKDKDNSFIDDKKTTDEANVEIETTNLLDNAQNTETDKNMKSPNKASTIDDPLVRSNTEENGAQNRRFSESEVESSKIDGMKEIKKDQERITGDGYTDPFTIHEKKNIRISDFGSIKRSQIYSDNSNLNLAIGPMTLPMTTTNPYSVGDSRHVLFPNLASQVVTSPIQSVIEGNSHINEAKPELSSFRKKIQDRISKSINGKSESTKNEPDLLQQIVDSKKSKKELSPSLSKLVLKMFMNTKSEKIPCSGSSRPICNPVSLWNKYKQIADWCTSLCPYGNCPSAVCTCTCEQSSLTSDVKKCTAQTAFREKSGELDQWCQKTCSSGDCPDLLCVCK